MIRVDVTRRDVSMTVSLQVMDCANCQARLWARAEPRVRLRTITRVRPAPWPDHETKWAVEIAYVVVPDQQEAGL